MMIPIRCFTCGYPVAAHYTEYKERLIQGEKPANVLNDIGLKRYCCRRMLLTQLDLIDRVAKFKRS